MTSISATVTVTLLDPTASERCLPGVTWAPRMPIRLCWVPSVPKMAYLQLRPSSSLADWLPRPIAVRETWHFSLELLTDGIDAPAGLGDVMVSPTYRRDLIEIILSAGGERIGLRTRRANLIKFLESLPASVIDRQ